MSLGCRFWFSRTVQSSCADALRSQMRTITQRTARPCQQKSPSTVSISQICAFFLPWDSKLEETVTSRPQTRKRQRIREEASRPQRTGRCRQSHHPHSMRDCTAVSFQQAANASRSKSRNTRTQSTGMWNSVYDLRQGHRCWYFQHSITRNIGKIVTVRLEFHHARRKGCSLLRSLPAIPEAATPRGRPIPTAGRCHFANSSSAGGVETAAAVLPLHGAPTSNIAATMSPSRA